MRFKAITFAVIIMFPGLAFAAGSTEYISDKSACSKGPVAQFGRYIGDWKITDESMAQDGTGWSPGVGARWIFTCIGPGLGVQDFWMPNDGGFGTNLRIFNPDTDSWEIVWSAAALNGFTNISAKQNDEGNVVMEILKPVPNPPRRITFFEPDDSGWHWAMQMSFDGGDTWVEVYRIVATPWEE